MEFLKYKYGMLTAVSPYNTKQRLGWYLTDASFALKLPRLSDFLQEV